MTSADLARQETSRPRRLQQLLHRPLAVFSLVVLTIVALLAVTGSRLAPHDPSRPSIRERTLAPSWQHLLGTDDNGRDQLSRVIAGARLSVGSGLFTLFTALLLGVIAGLIAGYRGGWFDKVADWLVAMLMALPAVVVLAAARSVFGPSLTVMMILLGAFISPIYYRLVYSSVRAVRNELYVDAARVSGLSDRRIVARHILTAVRAPIIVQSSIIAGMSIAILAGLEFIGLGNPDHPTWGTLLVVGFQKIYGAPWMVTGPAIALSLTSMAFVLLGNALRDVLADVPRPRRAPRDGAPVATAAKTTDRLGVAPLVHHEDATAEAALDVVLKVNDLHVAFDVPPLGRTEVVKGVSLDLRRGEVHGLIGESGSGKTQTSLAILGLLPSGGRITEGEVVLEGIHLEHATETSYADVRGRQIGYIPQEPMTNLDPSFTVGSQLTYPLVRCASMSKREARHLALDLLDRVGIPDPRRTFDSYPFEISGGMAQRVLIAGAVSMNPTVLIADEPTTALDVTVQAEVLDLLRDLQQERGMSMLLVTHNVGVVADLCDRVTVMQHGSFVEQGPVRAVLRSPMHTYTRQLLDALLDDAAPRARRAGGTEAAR